jgi:zinc transport system substrate-binding protein
MTRRRRLALATSLLASTSLVLAACASGGEAAGSDPTTSSSAASGQASVIAAFYPLEYAARTVGGEAVSVTSLTPPGVEPHDLELSAAQVAEIADADLVLYVKGFQPAVDEAVEQQAADRAIDLSAGLSLLAGEAHESTGEDEHADEGVTDPHIWLDPANMATIGATIADRLAALTPEQAAEIEAAAAAFAQDMAALDAEYTEALATCATRDLVVSHEAFGYLANAYDLTQVGISGLSPEAEPSPARLAEVAQLVRDRGITTVYYETLVDPRVARTLADETGATTAVLDPLEGLAPDSTSDYASIMRDNLATLVAGQSCS